MFAHAPRFGARRDQVRRQQAGADPVRIHGIGANAVGAVIERVLSHQGERRRLGNPVWPEIRPGIDRLLGNIEQEAAAGALRAHDPHRRLSDTLMAVEVQLEAVAQNILIDLADAPLPGRSRIGHDDVEAAEAFGDLVERRDNRARIGNIAGKRQRVAADRVSLLARGGAIEVEQRHLGAGRGETLCGCCSNGAAGAGNGGHLPKKRRRLARAEL